MTTARVSYANGYIWLSCAYDAALVAALRKIPYRRRAWRRHMWRIDRRLDETLFAILDKHCTRIDFVTFEELIDH